MAYKFKSLCTFYNVEYLNLYQKWTFAVQHLWRFWIFFPGNFATESLLQ